jgi:hypothetical protein
VGVSVHAGGPREKTFIPFFSRSDPSVNVHCQARQKASRAQPGAAKGQPGSARPCARALSGAGARGRTGSKPRAQGGLGLAGLPRSGIPHVQLAHVHHQVKTCFPQIPINCKFAFLIESAAPFVRANGRTRHRLPRCWTVSAITIARVPDRGCGGCAPTITSGRSTEMTGSLSEHSLASSHSPSETMRCRRHIYRRARSAVRDGLYLWFWIAASGAARGEPQRAS